MDLVWEAVSSFFLNFRIRDFIDIILISIVIYQVIKLTKQTRAISVMKGLGVLLLAAGVSEALRLQTINWLLTYVINYGVVVLVVLFQPDAVPSHGKLHINGRQPGIEQQIQGLGSAAAEALSAQGFYFLCTEPG